MCRAGRYTLGGTADAKKHDEASDCVECPAGKSSSSSPDSDSACDVCSAGKFETEAGKSSCSGACGAGKYTLGSDRGAHDQASDCRDCPAGKFSAGAPDTDSACDVCGAGKYNAKSGQDAAGDCQDCRKGTYLVNPASDATEHDAATGCALCVAGTFQGALPWRNVLALTEPQHGRGARLGG